MDAIQGAQVKHRLTLLTLTITACYANAPDMPRTNQFENSIGMKFIRIDPGSFMMGLENHFLTVAAESKWQGKKLLSHKTYSK
jgi:hypothetical protein